MDAIAPHESAIQAYLDSAVNHERAGTFRAIKLERITAFLRRLPAPPAPVTIAGTKGKGSTTRLAEAVAVAHGRPTLAFTSPHVVSVRERWRLDGQVADAATIAQACSEVQRLEHAQEPLTYFERTFAVACLLASARADTIFLCEVGLGGRLDCANALDCAVAVLTHLSFDHRDVLGPTLDHLAVEKLAVSRPGHPLVIAPQSPAAADAIARQLPPGAIPQWVASPRQPYQLALPGAHQQDNAATAMAAMAHLLPGLDPARARTAMARARLAARCQLLELPSRRILVDGAHNGPSLQATIAVAESCLEPGWTLVLGLAQDKEVEEVLAAIPAARRVVRCGYRSPRARNQGQWPERALAWPWYPDISQVLDALPQGDLCISGSFYLAGEALVALGHQHDLPG